jgi:hypothetical protein
MSILSFVADQGKTADNPNAGHWVLDIAPELQTAMIQAARREHKELEAWIVERRPLGCELEGAAAKPGGAGGGW